MPALGCQPGTQGWDAPSLIRAAESSGVHVHCGSVAAGLAFERLQPVAQGQAKVTQAWVDVVGELQNKPRQGQLISTATEEQLLSCVTTMHIGM